MPAIIDNPRHEKFAQLVASGKGYAEAFKKAGYAPDARNARTLAKHNQVHARIAELQAAQAKRVNIGVDTILKELNGWAKMAKERNQAAVGAQISMHKAKLLGLYADKAEVVSYRKPMREPTEAKHMSLDEWTEKFAPKHEEGAT